MGLYEEFCAETGFSVFRSGLGNAGWTLPVFDGADFDRVSAHMTSLVSKDAKTRGGKVGSAKQAARLNGSRHLIEIDNGALGYTITFDRKNRISFDRMIKVIFHKSPKGRVYEFIDIGSLTHYFFTAHYFDRVQERLFTEAEHRTVAIDNAFMQMFNEGYMLHHGSGLEVEVFTNWGLSLGKGLSITGINTDPTCGEIGWKCVPFLKTKEEILRNAVFLLTFVDNSLLRSGQVRNLERAERISPLHFNQSGKSTKSDLRKWVNEFRTNKKSGRKRAV